MKTSEKVLEETIKDYNEQVPGKGLVEQAQEMFPQFSGFQERKIHSPENPPQRCRVILLCTCDHCTYLKDKFDTGGAHYALPNYGCPCPYCQ